MKKMESVFTKYCKLQEWQKYYISICVLFFLIFIFAIPSFTYQGDSNFFISWSFQIYKNGLSSIYKIESNYLPLTHYILRLYTHFQKSYEEISQHIHYLKLFTLLFHFLSCYFLILIIDLYDKSMESKFKTFIYFLNISVLYNTIVWGQVDEIMSAFIIGSIYYGLKEKTNWSLIFFLLALNFKFQSIIFLPLVIYINIQSFLNLELKKKIAVIFSLLFIELLILMPFILSGDLNKIANVLTSYVDYYPVVSMNAFNFWEIIFPINATSTSDKLSFIGLSYRNWGLLLFFGLSLFAMFNYIKDILKYLYYKKAYRININQLFLVGCLIPLLFFYFNTQMHERYCHSAIIFIAAYSILNKKYLLIFLCSSAYLLNLDAVLKALKFQNYNVLIFNNIFISIIFAISILLILKEIRREQTRFTS